MASAFPYETSVDHIPREQITIHVSGDEPSPALQTVSSETAQQILGALREDPGTVSDVADAVDTSIQNAHYHLNRLREADIVEPVDTWYSAKGQEMAVYALAAEELIIKLGDLNASPPEVTQ